MRPALTFVLFCLAFVGCVAPSAPGAADDAPAGQAVRSESVELASIHFALTPARVEAAFEVVVPQHASNLVVQVAIIEGASVDFRLAGLAGCEMGVQGAAHLSGMRRSPECRVAPGTYMLIVSHTSGHVTGGVRVLGRTP